MTILIFIIILGLLIFVHELGHFVAAKRAGVRVDEFGFGFPPRLVGAQKKSGRWKMLFWRQKAEGDGNTIYSLNLIPLGGFVKIFGEEGEGVSVSNSFSSKSVGRRAAILLAGVFMNFILAAFLFGLGHFVGIPTALSDEEAVAYPESKVAVTAVGQNSPAHSAGLLAGDRVAGYIEEGEFIAIENITSFQGATERHKGREFKIIAERGALRQEIIVVPRVEPPAGEGPLGIALANVADVKYTWYESLWRGFSTAAGMVYAVIIAFYVIIKNLLVTGQAGMDVAGPVGIFNLTGQAAQMGFIYLVQLTALLSINLAVINALPFPALDGGRVLFLILEKIKGSPISQKVQTIIHTAGFAFLILLMLFITYRDIARLIIN